MVSIPGTEAGSESFSLDALKEQLGKQVTEGLKIDETLVKLRDKDPDTFDAKLMQMRKDYQEFYDEEGKIKLEVLKQKLNWNERMALLVSHYVGENVLSMFFSGNAERASTLPFSTLMDSFKAYEAEHQQDSDRRVDGNNLLWLGTSNPISQLMVLFNFASIFKEKTEEKEEPFPIPPQSRIILNASQPTDGPKMTPTRFSILEGICKSKGLDLDLLQVGEVESGGTVAKPSKDKIQVIFIPREGLPLGTDGKIDAKKLEWFQKVYEDGANNQWILAAPLLAAIYVRQGKPLEEALRLAKLSGAETLPGTSGPLSGLLQAIEVPGKPKEAPPPPPDLLKDVKTPEGTVDKAKLEEYQKKLEAGQGAWLTPAQKAGIFVLQGSPVEQAMATVGIATTDPSYAGLKADLETLVQSEEPSTDEEFPTSPSN